MTLEALLSSLLRQVDSKMSTHDLEYVSAILIQIKSQNFITAIQSNELIKIIKGYKKYLTPYTKHYLDQYVRSSKFELDEELKSDIVIKLENSEKFKKLITITSAFNITLTRYIKSNNSLVKFLSWSPVLKNWSMTLNETNIKFISLLCKEFSNNIIIDPELQQYINQVDEILNNSKQYIPQLIKENNLYKFKNTMHNITFDNLSDALYESKKLDIKSIDQNIIESPEYKNFTETELNFLSKSRKIIISKISELENLSKYLFPTIVMLPDDKELDALKECIEFFNSIGINNSEISVLFRLSNSYDKNFNTYIKDRNINYLCDNTTKVIFIKKVIPKIIFQKNINHTTLINFNSKRITYPYRSRLFLKNTLNEIIVS